MYRVLRDLDNGAKVGDIIDGEGINVEVMLKVRAISQVQAPPLEILPEISEEAEKLSSIGIEDAEDFLEADDDILMDVLEDMEEEDIEELKEDIMDYIK